MINIVAKQLRQEWRPEQISGFMAPLIGIGVSHQWIYALIWMARRAEAISGGTFVSLGGATSTGLDKIPNRVGIEHRPAEVNDRLFIGHREGDTVLKGHQQSGLVTLVERRSGYIMAAMKIQTA